MAVLEYDFDSNEEWNSFFKRLDFGNEPTEQQILRLKYKWYKKNVDSDFVIPTMKTETKVEEDAPADAAGGPARTSAPPPPTTTTTTKRKKETQPSSNNQSTFQGKSQAEWMTIIKEDVLKNGPQGMQYFMQDKIATFNWVLNIMFILNSTLCLFYNGIGLSFKIAMCTYLISLYKTFKSQIQLSKEFAARVMMDSNSHYLLYCIVFVAHEPLLLALLPLGVYAFYHAITFSYNAIKRLSPAFGKSQEAEVREFEIRKQISRWMSYTGKLEVAILPLLICGWFLQYFDLVQHTNWLGFVSYYLFGASCGTGGEGDLSLVQCILYLVLFIFL